MIFNRNTSRSDFKFYADRLIRLVIEESLNQLPYSDCSVVTPTGAIYDGLKWVTSFFFSEKVDDFHDTFVHFPLNFRYQSGNCGVSIVRSGEAMEQGLRDCCRSIRIGKILVESDAETHAAKVVYARFPDDIAKRQVLLMYPIMSTGNTVVQVCSPFEMLRCKCPEFHHTIPTTVSLQAVNVLKEHGVKESSIILSNLFCTPQASKTVVAAFPDMTILTSELHPIAPNHFGQRYFGTDWTHNTIKS